MYVCCEDDLRPISSVASASELSKIGQESADSWLTLLPGEGLPGTGGSVVLLEFDTFGFPEFGV